MEIFSGAGCFSKYLDSLSLAPHGVILLVESINRKFLHPRT